MILIIIQGNYGRNIYIKDKIIIFGRDVRFDLLIRIMTHLKVDPWRMLVPWKWGLIYSQFSTFQPVNLFSKKNWYSNIKSKIKLFCWRSVYDIGHACHYNLISYKIKITYFPKFCISVTNDPIWIKFAYTIVKWKIKWFRWWYFFHLGYISRTQSVFSNFESYLEIKKLLYSNQEPIELGRILCSESKIKK